MNKVEKLIERGLKEAFDRSDPDNERLIDAIDEDGLEYAIFDYSDWREIKDAKFKSLKKDYKSATIALKKYLGIR